MINAAQGGMAEVELSQLASQRAASNEVKQFAQQMIQDHTRANNKLSQLAKQKGVTLPTEMDAQHKALRTQLEKISGRSFDQQYMNAMETDHAKTVALFQSQTQQGQDPDVTAFAATTLPKLQQHWQMARAMTGNPAAQNPNSPNSPKP
jgi:putative membrane protein